MNSKVYILLYTILLATVVFALQGNGYLNRLNDICVLPSGKIGKCVVKEDCKSNDKKQNTTEVLCGNQPLIKPQNMLVCCEYGPRKVGELSQKICEERYLERAVPPLPLIVGGGGYDAKAKEYPHMAALGFGELNKIEWACGGSLIADQFVLTAAHCIHPSIGPLKFVRLGDLNIRNHTDDAKPQDFTVLETFIHPGYKPPSKYNDIALVKLNQPFSRTLGGEFIAPACLQIEHEIVVKNWTATGWGVTSLWSKGADHLQVVELYEYNDTVCQNTYARVSEKRLLRGVDKSNQICAGHERMDTCLGDSGGPLQFKNPKYRTGHTIVGITSFGMPCALMGKPGIYTRVSHYIEWIESILYPQ